MSEVDRIRASDRGFTLIEVLIVVVTMGLIATTLAMIVTTVLRTAPAPESRNDDARSLLGLTTFLPEDVNSTPPGGFDYGKSTPTGCAGASPGVNLVRLTWTEVTSSTETFHASYRYVDHGGWRIVRYQCRDGQTAQTNRMTSELPPIDEATWTPGTAPVVVTNRQIAGEDVGLSITVTTVAGDEIYLEMFSNNPAETLPLVPPGFYPVVPPGNQAPTASDVSVTTTPLTPVDIGLPAIDPDGDGVTITLSNVPTDWTTSISGTALTVTPPLAALPPTQISFDYVVIDPYGQAASARVEVTIVAVGTNSPPTASDYTGTAVGGTPLIINLPVSDPDGDALTTTVGPADPSLTIAVTGPTQLTVTSDGTEINPGAFDYTVSDGLLSVTEQVDLTVTTCSVTALTPGSIAVKRMNTGKLKDSVTYNVTYTGPCHNLVLEYDSDLSDGYQPVFLSFGSGTSVTVQGSPGGHSNWTVGDHTMTLRDSQTGPVHRTVDLTVTS